MSQERIIYISASTPLISAVKRVETLLSGNPKARGKAIEKAEEVTLKATGKAIVRALEIGCYFIEQGGERVMVRTGTVEVVDDVVDKVDWGGEEGAEGEQKKRKRGRKQKGKEPEGPDDVKMVDGEEIFMKTRKISMIEIIISSTPVN